MTNKPPRRMRPSAWHRRPLRSRSRELWYALYPYTSQRMWENWTSPCIVGATIVHPAVDRNGYRDPRGIVYRSVVRRRICGYRSFWIDRCRDCELILLRLLLCCFFSPSCHLLLLLLDQFCRSHQAREVAMDIFKLDEGFVHCFRPIEVRSLYGGDEGLPSSVDVSSAPEAACINSNLGCTRTSRLLYVAAPSGMRPLVLC